MSSAAALRLQIETALASRIPGALTPRPRVFRELAPTGIAELDTLLDGGLPIGAITELVGPHSSGRTTLALATLAETTQAGKSVALVDASDVLDPESAAAAGVVLEHLLWVRCGAGSQTTGIADTPRTQRSQAGAALLVQGSYTAASSGGCGSPHPRGEARGLSQAVDAFLQPDVFSRAAPPRDPAIPRRDRSIGTPGAPNRKLLDRTPQDARPWPRHARDREEQVPTDRQPSRRQVMQAGQHAAANQARSLQAAQIANTAAAAPQRSHAGAWTDNTNNAHGRCLPTKPNAIATGLPRFQEMEARAAGQGHGAPQGPMRWKPSPDDLVSAHTSPGSPDPRQGPAASQGKPHSLAGDPPSMSRRSSPLWAALDQALRATDLLLAAGGFSILVLDLGNIPAEFAWRIPLATWFRFRAAADRARTVFLLLTQHPCARSSAELVLRFSPARPADATTVLTGADFLVSIDRLRFETSPSPVEIAPGAAVNKLHLVTPRKQPGRERAAMWHSAAAWTGTGPRGTPGGPR